MRNEPLDLQPARRRRASAPERSRPEAARPDQPAPARREQLQPAELGRLAPGFPERLDANPDDIEVGLARLVLTLVELLRRVLEHQAVRRMEGGTLSDDEVERLGLALLRLQERMVEIRNVFGLEPEDLNIDLGPLGRLI